MGGTSYFVDSTKHEKYGFTEQDNSTLSQRNKWLAKEIHKSTRYVEGPKKTRHLGVTIDCKFPFRFKSLPNNFKVPFAMIFQFKRINVFRL